MQRLCRPSWRPGWKKHFGVTDGQGSSVARAPDIALQLLPRRPEADHLSAISLKLVLLVGILYVDEPWLSLRWDEEHKCVYSEWKAFANSAEFRSSLMKGLEAIREHHATRYLADSRKVKVIVREDQEWVNDTWIPMAAADGLRRLAVVLADAGLGKLVVE